MKSRKDEIRERLAKVKKDISPYVTAHGGIVILNGPFPIHEAEAIRVMLTNAPSDLAYMLEMVSKFEGFVETANNCGYCGNGSCRQSDKGCFDCPMEQALAGLERARSER